MVTWKRVLKVEWEQVRRNVLAFEAFPKTQYNEMTSSVEWMAIWRRFILNQTHLFLCNALVKIFPAHFNNFLSKFWTGRITRVFSNRLLSQCQIFFPSTYSSSRCGKTIFKFENLAESLVPCKRNLKSLVILYWYFMRRKVGTVIGEFPWR